MKKALAIIMVICLGLIFAGCGQRGPTEPQVKSSNAQPQLPSEVISEINMVKAAAVSTTTTAHSIEYIIEATGNSVTPISVYYTTGNSWQYEQVFTTPWYRAVTVTTSSCFLYTITNSPTSRLLTIKENGLVLVKGAANSIYQWIVEILD